MDGALKNYSRSGWIDGLLWLFFGSLFFLAFAASLYFLWGEWRGDLFLPQLFNASVNHTPDGAVRYGVALHGTRDVQWLLTMAALVLSGALNSFLAAREGDVRGSFLDRMAGLSDAVAWFLLMLLILDHDVIGSARHVKSWGGHIVVGVELGLALLAARVHYGSHNRRQIKRQQSLHDGTYKRTVPVGICQAGGYVCLLSACILMVAMLIELTRL